VKSKIFSISEERKVVSDVARVNSNFNLEKFTLWQFSHSLPKGVFISHSNDKTCIYISFNPRRIEGEYQLHLQANTFCNPVSLLQSKEEFIKDLNLTYTHYCNISKEYFKKLDLNKII